MINNSLIDFKIPWKSGYNIKMSLDLIEFELKKSLLNREAKV